VSKLPGSRLAFAALVLIVAAGLYAAAAVSRPAAVAQSSQAAGQRQAAVSTAVRACAGPGSAGATSGGVAIATAPAGSAAAAAGSAAITRLSSAAAPVGTVTDAGRLALRAVPAARGGAAQAVPGTAVPTVTGRGGVMVTASGPLAQGLEVEQTDSGGEPTARCGAPGTDFWFTGPGAASAASVELYLMNTDSQPADAQVTAATDSGPLLGSADTGVSVPAHGMVIQSLAGLLRHSRAVWLHVTTSVGQVVAAVREGKSTASPGTWLPAVQDPARHLVVPGLPGSAGARELYLAVPGTADAQVKLTAVTSKGSYQPAGGSGINLPSGSAVGIPLPSLGGIPAALKISANVPVTASLMVPGGGSGGPGAVTGATGPIQQQSVLAAVPGGSGRPAELVLSAPGGAASARLATATSGSAFGAPGQVVHVAAGHTITVRLRRPAGQSAAQFAVLITPQPGSGPLYAGRVISAGSAVSSLLPGASSLTSVPLPAVRSSLTAVLP